MVYVQYKIEGLEGLCNQLMAVFRTIGEALYQAGQNQSICILLNDVQTRNSIDLDVQPYFSSMSIDSYVDVDKLVTLLATRRISVRRSHNQPQSNQDQTITCRRYQPRIVLPNECREVGVFLAKSFPFAKSVSKLANYVIGFMSRYPRWKAIHLRIEGDVVHLSPVRDMGLETYTENQLQQTIDMISCTPNLSAVYIASGIQDEKYHRVVNILREELPHLTITRKKDILKNDPELTKEFESLCLEEQALVDWLVCLGAPFFAGQHTSSFAYLAGYMRYYRDFDKESTYLCPEYQPCWDAWFPRV